MLPGLNHTVNIYAPVSVYVPTVAYLHVCVHACPSPAAGLHIQSSCERLCASDGPSVLKRAAALSRHDTSHLLLLL